MNGADLRRVLPVKFLYNTARVIPKLQTYYILRSRYGLHSDIAAFVGFDAAGRDCERLASGHLNKQLLKIFLFANYQSINQSINNF